MRVLLVDDDPDDQSVFFEALITVDNNAEYLHLEDCNEIVEFLNTHSPEIVFLDVHLPKISGIQCLRNIRFQQQYKMIPIIMYSSNYNKQYTDMCKKEKANHFFVKPNSFAELQDIIRKVLGKDWNTPVESGKDEFIIS
jgi:CheY-like chemotaxis protein